MRVDGSVATHVDASVSEGQFVEIIIPQVKEIDNSPENIPLNIIYEDEHLIVVNKPAGMVVHPAPGSPNKTLVNALLHHCGDTLSGIGGNKRPGIVHRIDKDTSGLLVVACSNAAYKKLTEMISVKALERRYHAVCEGKLVSGCDIDRPIGRDPKNRTKQVVSMSGKEAFTEIRVLQRFSAHSLVQAELKTGRTHQIRVHLSSLGHPLVGDAKYGARRLLPKGIDEERSSIVREFKRQALHSAYLGFEHPITGEPQRFSAQWPWDFLKLVEALGGKQEIWS